MVSCIGFRIDMTIEYASLFIQYFLNIYTVIFMTNSNSEVCMYKSRYSTRKFRRSQPRVFAWAEFSQPPPGKSVAVFPLPVEVLLRLLFVLSEIRSISPRERMKIR